jgi:hypothetical protein
MIWPSSSNDWTTPMTESTPLCPRCGYDQSGTVATWKEACPLTGTCSECGLLFAWEDVLNPDRLRVPGFVEHARGLFQTARWSARTAWWSALIYPFWHRVKLEHPPHPARWLAYLFWTGAFWWLLVRAAYALKLAWLKLFGFVGLGWDQGELLSGLTFGIARYESWTRTWSFSLWGRVPAAAFGVLGVVIMMPVMLLALPYTRARLKIRPAHVVRAAVFGSLPLLTAMLLICLVETYEAFNPGWRTNVWGGSLSTFDRALYFTLRWLERYQLWFAALGMVWFFAWWAVALCIGFRADRWISILITQSLAAVLAGTALVLLHPDAAMLLYRWLL